MSDELNAIENSIKEILIDLMAKKVMSARIQASLMRGVQTSPSTTHGSGPSRDETEKRMKHHDDLANAKLIPSILPDYILPLAGAVSRDSVLRKFEYTIINVYLPMGIREVIP
jgi:hypothetical protein